jgi:hypothetical protein
MIRLRQLVAHVRLFPMAQDVAQPPRRDIQGSVQIVRAGRSHSEASVEALDEPGQEDVAVCHVGHARDAEFF